MSESTSIKSAWVYTGSMHSSSPSTKEAEADSSLGN